MPLSLLVVPTEYNQTPTMLPSCRLSEISEIDTLVPHSLSMLLQVVISQQELKHFATEAITGKLGDVPEEGFDEDVELPKHRYENLPLRQLSPSLICTTLHYPRRACATTDVQSLVMEQ